MEKWINQTLTTDLLVILRSLFKEELLQTKGRTKFTTNLVMFDLFTLPPIFFFLSDSPNSTISPYVYSGGSKTLFSRTTPTVTT